MTTPNLFSFFESANERRSPVEPGVLPAYAPARAGTAAPADLLADLNEPQREAVLHAHLNCWMPRPNRLRGSRIILLPSGMGTQCRQSGAGWWPTCWRPARWGLPEWR